MVGIATIRKLARLEETLLDGANIQMGKPPEWARQLVTRIGRDFGRTDLPSIYWRRHLDQYSSTGLTQIHQMLKRCVISVRQGRHEADQLNVVLHELAHWLVGIGEHPSEIYYAQAFKLFAAYGDPIYSLGREIRYHPTESLGGLKLSGLDISLVAQMLEAREEWRTKTFRGPTVKLLMSNDGQELLEVRTDRALTDEERVALVAKVTAMKPLTASNPVFSVGAPGTWTHPRRHERQLSPDRLPSSAKPQALAEFGASESGSGGR